MRKEIDLWEILDKYFDDFFYENSTIDFAPHNKGNCICDLINILSHERNLSKKELTILNHI